MQMGPVPDFRSLLEAELGLSGLRLRGVWHARANELPALPLPTCETYRVCMVGVAGSTFWPHFMASPISTDGLPDPLDRWSRAVGDALAVKWGGCALYPFEGPPYYPFQQWAARAEPLQTSPLKLRMHPQFGLWHADRFALVLPSDPAVDDSPEATPQPAGNICLQCSGQPCLTACPVEAFTPTEYRLEQCVQHLHSGLGSACMEGGCLARRACPVGASYRYIREHADFHMRAFSQAHQTEYEGG